MRRRSTKTVFILLAIVSLLSACSGSALAALGGHEFKGVVLDPPTEKPSFTLTDTSGEEYHFAEETEGRLTFLYFGYLTCPDICPVHLAQLAEVFERNPEWNEDSVVVFVSIDPGRDEPGEIRTFLDAFDSDFVGLTGTEEELATAQEAAGAGVAYQVPDDKIGYTMAHAGQVFVYAPNGKGYTQYPFGTRQTDWDNDLPVLIGRE